MAAGSSSGGRTRARELMVQALYQKQIAGHECGELERQFREQAAYERVDKDYFDECFRVVCRQQEALAELVSGFADRPVAQLDPIEFSILLIGAYELRDRIEIPYRVVINEGVNLAKRFGAADGHKYINACLDRAAQDLRAIETRAEGRG